MLTHLLVLVDGSAPSFCHYAGGGGPAGLMPPATLRKAVAFAADHGLSLTFVLGRDELPPEHRAVLAGTTHAAIVPAALAGRYPDAVLVADPDAAEGIAGAGRHVILRAPREKLSELAALVRTVLAKAARLDIRLGDIDRYTAADIGEYERQLEAAAAYVTGVYRRGRLPEVSIFSDRMLLGAMNNCDAGVVHLTAAPNGNLYICPGFYYDDEDNPAGSLENGAAIANSRLLRLANAPVCSCCDAYHCKRCVYLNKKMTLEWNTPSREQCVLAHLERNTARSVQQALLAVPPFARQRLIPAIDYLDPFEQIATRRLPT
jgi:CXXX repeat peptide maturase